MARDRNQVPLGVPRLSSPAGLKGLQEQVQDVEKQVQDGLNGVDGQDGLPALQQDIKQLQNQVAILGQDDQDQDDRLRNFLFYIQQLDKNQQDLLFDAFVASGQSETRRVQLVQSGSSFVVKWNHFQPVVAVLDPDVGGTFLPPPGFALYATPDYVQVDQKGFITLKGLNYFQLSDGTSSDSPTDGYDFEADITSDVAYMVNYATSNGATKAVEFSIILDKPDKEGTQPIYVGAITIVGGVAEAYSSHARPDFNARDIGNSRVLLEWSGNAQTYNVYKDGLLLLESYVGVFTEDLFLEPGVATYAVAAIEDGAVGPISKVVTVLVTTDSGSGGGGKFPTSPKNVQATKTSSSTISLSWEAGDLNSYTQPASGYVIYEQVGEDGDRVQIATVGPDVFTYDIPKNYIPGTYYFGVGPIDDDGYPLPGNDYQLVTFP